MAAGRPRIEIDEQQFENLCKLQCTLDEIASFFSCSPDTIERWCKRTYDEKFAEVFKKKSAKGKASLRRIQFKLAEKNVAMAIFLGKQYLGQSDNPGKAEEEERSIEEGEVIAARAIADGKFYANIGAAFYGPAGHIFNHSHTHFDFSGGRGSLKSSFVSLAVIRLVMFSENHDQHAVVLRKVGNTLRDSVYAQYMWAIGQLGVADFWDSKTSPMELVFRPTGQKIMFRGAYDPMKIKSIKVPFGYIAITHFEEKDQFAGRREIRTILQSTMRGGAVFWNFESYNPPISRDNWANKDSLEERADRFCHKSTYLDVQNRDWLGDQFLSEAEYLKETNEKAYQHEYLGIPVGTGGNVFENLEIRAITDEEVGSFDRIYNGVDWGYFPDPWAFNRVHFDAARRTLFVFCELEAVKKGNRDTADMLVEIGMTHDDMITADSAEPKSVADYQSYGFRTFGAQKGPGSVDYSMKWLQSLNKIVIDPVRCPKTAAEFNEYEYERGKDGEIITGYPDKNNHHIDAIRYATERVWRKRGQ
jgi:PBSX family phage terminase large subunit